jgi:hypothetical protein
MQKYDYGGYPGFFNSPNRKDPSLMRSTSYGEFGPGCSIFYQTTYAVHLLQIFDLHNKKQIQTTVKSYLDFWYPEWCGAWCTINVLRMLIEHPLSAESRQVNSELEHLAKLQTKTGAWKGSMEREHGKAFHSTIRSTPYPEPDKPWQRSNLKELSQQLSRDRTRTEAGAKSNKRPKLF